ncbi:MAG: hypothetical protein M3342_08485 [Bacteroidota bacterium]|nr:hypothetical protein [Flavisolibacter sp.]MDQ3844035.1 hypothetical protein [Bacteroidota bacterium]
MDRLLIQLTNAKAYRLLQDMEELNLIRIIKEPVRLSSLRRKINTRMNSEAINKQLQSMLNEWQNDI